ncbi:MAG: hypothetical protein K8J08_16915 [Thermoanaerobaculia bacterium]|nr:hypothetical protein [Thermoanaerobaculia bacterium]
MLIGNKLKCSKSWKTSWEFLIHYLGEVMGSEWGNEEIRSKKLPDRHPVMQWYDGLCRSQTKYKDTLDESGFIHGVVDGRAWAYVHLAYDLYLMADRVELHDRLVDRLRDPREFQGARYELSVASHCVRAGFTVAIEDDTDTSTQHPDFIATHKATGEVIAIEAKSRHRPGVLGYEVQALREPEPSVRSIALKALKKRPAMPYVIFIDLNLPPIDESNERTWENQIADDMERLRKLASGHHEMNAIMLTNYSPGYASRPFKAPRWSHRWYESTLPLHPVSHPEALADLRLAHETYGIVPLWFNDEPIGETMTIEVREEDP